MSNERTQYAISHILVAGTTLWCMYKTNPQNWHFMSGTYGSLCFYSFLGTWRYGNPQYGDDAAEAYEASNKLVMALAFPCLVAELYTHYGYDEYVAIAHAAVPLVPISLLLARDDWEQDLMDLILLGNCISCCVLSIVEQSHYAMAATLSYLCNHFILRTREIANVPAKICFNIGLCFYVSFAWHAVLESRITP